LHHSAVHVTSLLRALENRVLMARQNGEPRKAEILSIKQRNSALTF
jgi:hypothetical protein